MFSKRNRESNSSSKIKYVRNDLIEEIITNCRGVKKCNDGINRMKKRRRKKIRAASDLK